MRIAIQVMLFVLTAPMLLTGCKEKSAGKEPAAADTTVVRPVAEKEYFPTGELKMAGKVKAGKREGQWASWYQSGMKNSEAFFVNGEMDGPYQVWWENGQPRIQGQYQKGKEVGTWYFFEENGDTSSVEKYPDPR